MAAIPEIGSERGRRRSTVRKKTCPGPVFLCSFAIPHRSHSEPCGNAWRLRALPEFKLTDRGFGILNFEDFNGHGCSLQESSSLASDYCIWLGIDDPAPQRLVPNEGWQEFPIPDDVLVHTRMHLSRAQVVELLPTLQHFAETGELPRPAPEFASEPPEPAPTPDQWARLLDEEDD